MEKFYHKTETFQANNITETQFVRILKTEENIRKDIETEVRSPGIRHAWWNIHQRFES
jgi:hypothetical protein